MLVNMPVEAIGERCLTCPELEIDITTNELYGLTASGDGTTAVMNTVYNNSLKCTHYNRCKVIFEHGKEPEPAPAPEKETKKPARKTTKATDKITTKATKAAKK